jgi:protein-L-isoaspartate(D-aspartate) O-methyltransferase
MLAWPVGGPGITMNSPPPEPRRKFPLQLEGLGRAPKKAMLGGVVAALSTPAIAIVELDPVGRRQRMLERLREAGLRHPAVMEAMGQVARHIFIDSALGNQAYEDTSLPIGLGQTISKPSVVARMVELLMAGCHAAATGGLGQTLEIGTGCGYQTAVLARLSRQLISVERLQPLFDKALQTLAPLNLSNVRLVYGDGMRGHPPNAPYTSIIAAAVGQELPQAWLEQLAIGGRLVAPVQDAGGARQVLVVIDKTEHGCTRSEHEAVNFVPLKSGKN